MSSGKVDSSRRFPFFLLECPRQKDVRGKGGGWKRLSHSLFLRLYFAQSRRLTELRTHGNGCCACRRIRADWLKVSAQRTSAVRGPASPLSAARRRRRIRRGASSYHNAAKCIFMWQPFSAASSRAPCQARSTPARMQRRSSLVCARCAKKKNK